jgi:type I restriction enzyme S subunit
MIDADELPEDWKFALLSEICLTKTGGTPSRKNPAYFSGQIPWVKSGELKDGWIMTAEEGITERAVAESNAKTFPNGTLLMAMYGANVGKLGRLAMDAATNQAVCAFFPKPELDSDFLWHYLRAIRAELLHNSFGAAQPNISQTLIKALEIPLPPLAEQRRLVARIESLTSRLEQARQARQVALAEAATVFQRALELSFDENATDDWNEYSADELFEIVSGQVSPLDLEFSELTYLGPEHVETGTGRIIGERVSVAELKMKSGKYRFTPEHVVYSKIRPALRKVCTPDYSGLCSADMYALKPKLKRVTRDFLKFSLLAPAFSDYAIEKSDRNAMPKINQTALMAFRFRAPDVLEQERIASFLNRLLAKHAELRRLQAETEAELAAFTPALLAKAFRGEL